MPRTEDEQLEWELNALGCPMSVLEESKPKFVSNGMYAMMILSDAQEVMQFEGGMETARQYINRGKVFIRKGIEEAMKKKEEVI